MPESSTIDFARVARETDTTLSQVEKTVELLDEGNTIPFITRYRKDQTGGLNEEQIEAIRNRVAMLRQLELRKQTILKTIEAQGKLTDALRTALEQADNSRRLEDLYLPYRPKKQTLATKAQASGLAPLAREILTADQQAADLDARAAQFINEDKDVRTIAEALLGAGHILAEQFSERADLRGKARNIVKKSGKLASTSVVSDEKRTAQYRDYLEYSEPLKKVPPHRVLAINRGEKVGVLRIRVDVDHVAIERLAIETLVPADHPHKDFLAGCARDAVARLIIPSLEREVRRDLTERAEEHAVQVFARNLKNLLLQAPLSGRRVLAIDPGFKNGCKTAALDEFGKPLEFAVVHIIGAAERIAAARETFVRMIREHNVNAVALGNGTACRETEQLLADIFASELSDLDIGYTVVNEAGASVYSTSPIGREELPDCDPNERGAISIGRRLQDPLSELVKIDPASIGVGLYQHDTKPRHLKQTLDEVVQSCVSFVGVDVNTASTSLLRYVSGLNQLTARRLYEFRQQHGPIRSRRQLLDISGFGEATFVQAAGFLKIEGGEEPLDTTWIHPENYDAARKLLERAASSPEKVTAAGGNQGFRAAASRMDRRKLADELAIGELALADLIDALARPGRDPRADLPPPIFRKDILKIEDLEAGMELAGTVLNVVDFGAFVDVGLPDSGLVHVSQLSNQFVRDPHDVVAVGDRVQVWVTAIDADRRRVSLTMVQPGTERKPEPRPKREGRRRRRSRQGGPEQERAPAAGDRREKRPRRERPSRPKKPLVPLSPAMAEGKEPMRTFGDLLQFYQKKQDGDEAPPTRNGSS
jgi:protein Tex